MYNLKNIRVSLEGVFFDNKTNIEFYLKSGAIFSLQTPLSKEDFVGIWEHSKKNVKILTGKDSFACIDKQQVISYRVSPIT